MYIDRSVDSLTGAGLEESLRCASVATLILSCENASVSLEKLYSVLNSKNYRVKYILLLSFLLRLQSVNMHHVIILALCQLTSDQHLS
jgi:hypothetical protein